MVFEPFLGLFAGMFRVIVLLKDDVLGRFAVMGQTFLKFVIHNLDEKVPIHPTLNLESCMHTQAHPKACSPTSSQTHLQTPLYPLPAYHSAPLLPFSKSISYHLTHSD